MIFRKSPHDCLYIREAWLRNSQRRKKASSTELKNMWSFTSTPLYAFNACYLHTVVTLPLVLIPNVNNGIPQFRRIDLNKKLCVLETTLLKRHLKINVMRTEVHEHTPYTYSCNLGGL
jgi:hypothetical protein